MAKQEKQIELEIDDKIFNKFYLPYLFDYSHKIEVHKGSAGSGKSMWAHMKIILRAIQEKRTVLFIRKVADTHKTSCWQLVLDILEQFQYLDNVKINLNEYRMTFPNGSVFLFKGIDKNTKIKSIVGITDIIIDEADELILSDYTQLLLRLRTKLKQPQVYVIFNPTSKTSWVYKTFNFTEENQTQKIREYDNVIVFCTTYKDNKFLSDDYIQELENMQYINYNDYLVYTKGLFSSMDKKIYTNWTSKEFDWKELKKENPDMIAIFGMDFGYINDESTLVASLVNEDKKEIYIFEEFYEKGKLNNELAQMIKDKGYAKEIIIADSAERKSIDEIKKYGIPRIKPARKGKGSILQGIQKLQQYKIIVHPSCVNTIQELQNYSWKKDKQTNEFYNEAQDSYNHILDALRYSIQSIKKKPKIIRTRFF